MLLLFLVSIARTTGTNMSVEKKESQINHIIAQIFFPKILSNHNITRENYDTSIQSNFNNMP